MSELSRTARRQMREKARQLVGQTPGSVDASDYGPEEVLDAGVKTGLRPLSRRQFRKGGKVMHVDGKEAQHHAGRKPRKKGGAALTPDNLQNRDLREANEERDGTKHVGGFKKGGRTKHADGGVPSTRFNFGPTSGSRMTQAAGLKRGGHADEAEDRSLIKRMVKAQSLTGRKGGGRAKRDVGGALAPLGGLAGIAAKEASKSRGGSLDGELQGTRPTGGRLARKDGGKNWIAGAIKHPGALHKALHVKEGEKIPSKKLAKAEHSKSPHLRKQAQLAETLKGLNREGRASGGRTKGKTDINIIIGAGGQKPDMMPPIGAAPVGPGATPVPVPLPPAGASGLGAGAAPSAAPPMPPAGAPPMPRKRGGRAYQLDAGAGSGEGRLEKCDWYGKQ